MTDQLALPAPAKINHFLHVTGRLDDGYHALQTMMQFISLHDDIILTKRRDTRITCTMDGVKQHTNLALDAVELLDDCHLIPFGVDIDITKRIPMGGGLGGGSSDAATVLLALNEWWSVGLTRKTLTQKSLSIGADVPLFVQGENAIAEAKGEQLTAVELESQPLITITPPIHVNTGDIFNDPRLTRDTSIKKIRCLLNSATQNDLQAVTVAKYPLVGEALEWLNHFADARMSGSGATVFAWFERLDDAKSIAKRARLTFDSNWQVNVCTSLKRHPLQNWTL